MRPAPFFRPLVSLLAAVVTAAALMPSPAALAASAPARARQGMVVTQDEIGSKVGFEVIRTGGNAIDAAVATAFALAVTHPTAGNIGGGGFIVYRPASGEPVAYDFREKAPAAASPDMWLKDGKYDSGRHHFSHRAVGVPGTVAGLHLAWKEQGSKPWKDLLQPAIRLARDGFEVSHGLARSLEGVLPQLRRHPASIAQFSRNGTPYAPGDVLRQPDLARSLERIADQGPAGFYEGETARLIVEDMKANDGLITLADLKAYEAKRRAVVTGTYRGFGVIGMPPPSSGGIAVIQALNILEGYDLAANGPGSARNVHFMAEAMRRVFADRARHVGDPDFNPELPLARLLSKEHAAELRRTINPAKASKSASDRFEWPYESQETTHFSVVDAQRNAVALTYTLEYGYGSRIVVPGAGFLLNNEMGDFNAVPGLTDETGMIGTAPNLARPGKRMLSSMSPTILTKDGQLFMVTGAMGGRTIINSVLNTIIHAVDFGFNAQEAIDAPRLHHQWLPDRIAVERNTLSPDTLALLRGMGHTLFELPFQGIAEAIILNPKDGLLEGGVDRRLPDGFAAGR
jgi:gamma-glutamyltranspeptidase/glutathione hydrolase